MNELLIDRLKKARVQIGLKQQEVAEQLGVKANTISNWEKGRTEPDIDSFVSLCDIYKIDCASLLADVYAFNRIGNDISLAEYERIKKYRNLDDFGKETVDTILARETNRVAQLRAKQERIDALEAEQQKISEKLQSLRIYAYFGEIACAGPGFYFDEIPTETMEAPDMGGDFIIGVNGDSMEPDYHNGDKLYVKKTEYISHGDVGIFTIGNECFLKEYGEEGLISRNKDYDDIPGTEDVRLIGKVIGKVEE